MSSVEPPNPPQENNNSGNDEKHDEQLSTSTASAVTDAAMDTTPDQPPEETWADIPEEIMGLTTDEIMTRTRLIDNDLKVRIVSRCLAEPSFIIPQVIRSETMRLQHEQNVMKEKIRDNGEKIKQNKVLPYLVSNVVEARRVFALPTTRRLIYIRFWTCLRKSKKTVRIAM